MRKNNVKKFFVQMFVALFVFESVLASGMPLIAQTVSENNLSVVNTEEIVEERVTTEEVDAEKATENDLKWTIDSEGHLYVTGSGDYDDYPDWVDNVYKRNIITATVDATGMTTTNHLFNGCENLKSVDFSNFNTSQVTGMHSMFFDCYRLTSVNLSNFDTSQVTDMGRMFSDCYKLTSLDLSNFKTSQVMDMSWMFSGCALISLDLSNFDTSRVTDMRGMFNGCDNLTSLDLSNFDTSQVTDMRGMFSRCTNLTSLDLSNFDTSQVTDMGSMFDECISLTSVNLSNFDTSQVTDMGWMFDGCRNLTSIVAPQNKSSQEWDLPEVEGYIWYYKPDNTCVTTITKAGTYVRVKEGTIPEEEETPKTEEETTPVIKTGTKFEVSNIQYEVVAHTSSKHTVKVYKGKKNTATSIKIPKTVTYQGTTFDVVSIGKNAFKGYKKATKLTIGNKVTSIGESAFQNCTKLKTVTIGNAVTSIGKKAFYGCKALTSISIPSKVKTVGESSFSNCTKLKTVIMGSSVKTIGASAFKGDSKITTINIYSKKLSKVGKSAFSGIDKYAKIYVPDSKLSAYKKLLKNRGQKSTVKIVKQSETKYTGKSVIAIGNCEISYEKEFKYTGKAIKPKVTVTYNNSTLTKGTNYTVSYKNNTEPGTATIVIKGKGIYVGTVEKNFTIYKKFENQGTCKKNAEMLGITYYNQYNSNLGDKANVGCGVCCVAMVASHYGIKTTPAELKQLCGGKVPHDTAAGKIGLKLKKLTAGMSQGEKIEVLDKQIELFHNDPINNAPPMISVYNSTSKDSNHYLLIVEKYNETTYIMLDPASNSRTKFILTDSLSKTKTSTKEGYHQSMIKSVFKHTK